jgi:hypothetical protein
MDTWGLKVVMWKNGSLVWFVWEAKGEGFQSQEIVMAT